MGEWFKNLTRSSYAVFALIVIFTTIPFYFVVNEEVDSNREGCVRLDVVRVSLYDSYEDASVIRPEVREVFGGKVPPFIKVQSEDYKQRAKDLLESTKKYTDDLDDKDSPVHIDCIQAYPKPFPLNLVD